MAAELEIDLGSAANAAVHYNKVRARAFGESYSSVSTVTLEQIFEERKLEFALEGIRYWDLLRRGMPVLESAVQATNLGGIYDSAVNSAARGFWPIPSGEIALSNYELKQNVGY